MSWILEANGADANDEARSLGTTVYVAACLMLGAVELALGKPLPELHPWGDGVAARFVSGATLVLFAAAAFARPLKEYGALGLALHWAAAFAATSYAALETPWNWAVWVPATKTAIFMLMPLSIMKGDTSPSRFPIPHLLLRIVVGLTFAFYGLFHLFQGPMIAALIPAWIPQAELLPWLTGALLLIAGTGVATGVAVRECSLAVAALFASWIPLLHVERIARQPLSSFEWTFALSALALAGVSLSLFEWCRSRRTDRLTCFEFELESSPAKQA